MNKRWITGAELLERWNYQPFELVAAMVSEELNPVDPKTGRPGYERWDCRGSCFYCDKASVDRFTICSESSEYPHPADLPIAPGATTDPPLIVRCSFERHGREIYRADLAIKSTFAMAEVQAFEHAHGLRIWTQADHDAVNANEAGHDQQIDGYATPLSDDEPKDFINRLKGKGVHDDEIQYRLYEFRLPRWRLTQWKAHCLVNEIPYPPKGMKGEVDRDNYGKAYGRAKDRHQIKVKASEKSEKVPE